MAEQEIIKQLESEIRATIHKGAIENYLQRPIYQNTQGQRLFINEVHQEHNKPTAFVGALAIVYAEGSFMTVDRIKLDNKGKFKKNRRIIYYLDSRPGQIGSTLLLELLKIEDGEEFSKHKFVQRIDKEYFQKHEVNLSLGEINEALSRMFRKTMPEYFAVEGKYFRRQPFLLSVQELGISRRNTTIVYQSFKNQIDHKTFDLISRMNRNVNLF